MISLFELKEKYIGPKGDPNREEYEKSVSEAVMLHKIHNNKTPIIMENKTLNSNISEKDLYALHSELQDLNEACSSLINEIAESLNRIKPYVEGTIPDEIRRSIPEIGSCSFVDAMKKQIRFTKENLYRLNYIARHLNDLI